MLMILAGVHFYYQDRESWYVAEVVSIEVGETRTVWAGGFGINQPKELREVEIRFRDGNRIKDWAETPLPPIGQGSRVELRQRSYGGVEFYHVKVQH